MISMIIAFLGSLYVLLYLLHQFGYITLKLRENFIQKVYWSVLIPWISALSSILLNHTTEPGHYLIEFILVFFLVTPLLSRAHLIPETWVLKNHSSEISSDLFLSNQCRVADSPTQVRIIGNSADIKHGLEQNNIAAIPTCESNPSYTWDEYIKKHGTIQTILVIS